MARTTVTGRTVGGPGSLDHRDDHRPTSVTDRLINPSWVRLSPRPRVQDSRIFFHGQRRSPHDLIARAAVLISRAVMGASPRPARVA